MAAPMPATAGGTTPAARTATNAAVTTSVRRAPGPSATAWRRTASGGSTTSTSPGSSRSSSTRHEPSTSSASPAASTSSGVAGSSPWRRTERTTSSPLSVTMPGKTRRPISGDRGATTTSAMPASRVKSSSGTSRGCRPYCSTSVCAWWVKSGGSERARRSGSSRSPSTSARTTVPATSGRPTSANSKKPKRPAPASAAASDTRMLTGEPVSTSSDPAWAPNASGISSFDGGRPSRVAITTIIGTRAATAPLGVMTADSTAHRISTNATRRVGSERAARTSRWPGPGRHAAGVERLGDHEERRDEQDGGIAEAGERLLQRHHAGRVQGERDGERDHGDREAVPDEEDDGRRQDDQGDRGVVHEPVSGPAIRARGGSRAGTTR